MCYLTVVETLCALHVLVYGIYYHDVPIEESMCSRTYTLMFFLKLTIYSASISGFRPGCPQERLYPNSPV